MGKVATFHIHVKSEPGYSTKYQEHVFSVIGLSLCRHGLDHKLRQITNCDSRDSWIVAICDCRNLWQFQTQLLRSMSIVPEGILLSTENTFTYTSDNFNKVSLLHRLWTSLSWKVPYAFDRPLTSLPPGMLMSTSYTKHQSTNPQIHPRHRSWHVTHTPLDFHTAPNGSDCQFPLAQHLGKQSCSL